MPPNTIDPVIQACTDLSAGATCQLYGTSGICKTGQCCHLDYAGRVGEAAPPQKCEPCMTCVVPEKPLQQLVIPGEVTEAQAVTPVAEAATATVSAAGDLAAPVTAVAVVAQSPDKPPAKTCCSSLWLAGAVVLAVVAIAMWRKRSKR